MSETSFVFFGVSTCFTAQECGCEERDESHWTGTIQNLLAVGFRGCSVYVGYLERLARRHVNDSAISQLVE